jgi:hypothetical protein
MRFALDSPFGLSNHTRVTLLRPQQVGFDLVSPVRSKIREPSSLMARLAF